MEPIGTAAQWGSPVRPGRGRRRQPEAPDSPCSPTVKGRPHSERPFPSLVVAKLLDKVLANRIQQYVKNTHHDQVALVPSMQSWFHTEKAIHVIYHINESKNHRSIVTDAGKAPDRASHPFMIKSLRELIRSRGNLLNLINRINKNPTASITLSGKRLNAFLLTLGMRKGHLLTTATQHPSASSSL